MFDYFTKSSINNLTKFTVESIHFLVGNRIFLQDHQDFFKYCLHSFNKHKPVRETYLKDGI